MFQIFHKKGITWLILALFAIPFTGCVDDVNLDDQLSNSSRLVLFCRLCPQLDTTWVFLSHSQPLYGNGSSTSSMDVLSDGMVELSADGDHWVQATFNTEKQRYMLARDEFPVEEGHTYFIRASHKDYKTVTAACTVPVQRPVEARLDTVEAQGDIHMGSIWNLPHKDAYLQWHDYPGEDNYYAFVTYEPVDLYYGYSESQQWFIGYYWGYTVLSLNENECTYVSDDGRDGQILRYLTQSLLPPEEENTDYESVYYLAFLDRNTYLFETTMGESDSYFNLFLLEPMHAHSNVENGFGIFGAMTLQRIN